MSIRRKRQIYFDYAATTPVDPRVMKAMSPYFSHEYGNASSVHLVGQASAKAVDRARDSVADFLNCKTQEVIFTSGATEANNLAIKGAAEAMKKFGNHIITSQIEHPCVLESCRYLEKRGFKVTYLPVYKNGVVKVEDVEKAITDKKILVSIMYVNNEIGTIQPISEIGQLIQGVRKSKVQSSNYSKSNSKSKCQMPIFHCDATQAVNYLDCNVDRLGVDLLSISAHKIYGPKGMGALCARKRTPIEPLFHGGHQEYGLRAGTFNHSGIVGFGKAIEIVQENKKAKKQENKRIERMRDEVIDTVLKTIPGTRLNGDRKLRASNNVNVSFEGVEGEALLMMLDFEGIAVSTGSACASGSLEPSHVLMALGMCPVQAHGSIRITLGRFTKESEIKKLLAILPKAVERLRKISMGH